jgi:LacI family transcriptional regulator
LGLNVPEDVAIMGYDNIKLSKYLDLTTIDQKMYTIGVQATKRLSEIIEKPDDELYQTTINPVLVQRGSTENKQTK